MKSLFLILISVVAATASEHFTLVSKAAAGASDSSAITLFAGDTAALTFAWVQYGCNKSAQLLKKTLTSAADKLPFA